jgi:L-asparaginase
LGSLPPARDPDNPTARELAAIEAAVQRYQGVFDTH